MQSILDFITEHWEHLIAPLAYEIGAAINKKRNLSLISGIVALIGLVLKNKKEKK